MQIDAMTNTIQSSNKDMPNVIITVEMIKLYKTKNVFPLPLSSGEKEQT